MSATNEESIPSEKMRELEQGKVVVKPSRDEQSTVINAERKKYYLYLLISELILLGAMIIFFTLMGFYPQLFFTVSFESMTYYLVDPYVWTVILMAVVPAFALANTYIYIFGLEPSQRGKIYIVRALNIVALLTLSWQVITPSGHNISRVYDTLIGIFILLNYCFGTQLVLRTFLLTTEETIKNSLFRKDIAGSPSELEWRKFNKVSGYLAVIFGVISIQMFWLIYHVFIRPSIVRKAKRRLIINSLNFEEEVNLSTVALDIGISLEEVIFLLKQLQLKRHIKVEFTRYGAVLKEVRKVKWFSFVIQEKHDAFLNKQKMTEYEIKANRFIELTERNKLKLSDFRRILEIDEDYSLDELILLLPPKVAKIRKPLFYTHYHMFFDHGQALLLREKITKIFVENGDKIFGKSTPKKTTKTKSTK